MFPSFVIFHSPVEPRALYSGVRSLRRLAPRSILAEVCPLICAVALGCGGSPHEVPIAAPIAMTPDAGGHLNDPDLNRPPAPKLLAIDWANVKVASDADAIALWKQIAPTGEDWQQRLDEIPPGSPIQHALAVALLR